MWQTPLTTFHDQYADKIVTYWNNQKGRKMHQGKRKEYKKQNSSKKILQDIQYLRVSGWTMMMIVWVTMIWMTSVQMKTMHSFFTMLSKFGPFCSFGPILFCFSKFDSLIFDPNFCLKSIYTVPNPQFFWA